MCIFAAQKQKYRKGFPDVKSTFIKQSVAFFLFLGGRLPQHHVHHHHQDEADGKADRGEVCVVAFGSSYHL